MGGVVIRSLVTYHIISIPFTFHAPYGLVDSECYKFFCKTLFFVTLACMASSMVNSVLDLKRASRSIPSMSKKNWSLTTLSMVSYSSVEQSVPPMKLLFLLGICCKQNVSH